MQCWQFSAIFACHPVSILLPLRFYVKSNCGEFNWSKKVIFGKFRGSQFCILVSVSNFSSPKSTKRLILCEIEEFCHMTVWKSHDFAFTTHILWEIEKSGQITVWKSYDFAFNFSNFM